MDCGGNFACQVCMIGLRHERARSRRLLLRARDRVPDWDDARGMALR
jgi:hypothetical protein